MNITLMAATCLNVTGSTDYQLKLSLYLYCFTTITIINKVKVNKYLQTLNTACLLLNTYSIFFLYIKISPFTYLICILVFIDTRLQTLSKNPSTYVKTNTTITPVQPFQHRALYYHHNKLSLTV